ncbi:Mitochondrial carnitine/acylcarnitine carrier-like protein [Tetrabaena socialis]|uniref:Mitochondrial carnitine/acylcarnitine carrier-like protein n=1 Tax=Tetrabaena socialis TaxID=47790 RepID=A0A2J7ZVE5_9CHLO|nr:Mitochondrial carnitine/acylcarnitine carrier-like protein [Tetrabaena socialis]|eukprot:PNH04257.1 Mitochondrial carnitine/acylcarnitine carrier-like protein [Tetrabaena socialis]
MSPPGAHVRAAAPASLPGPHRGPQAEAAVALAEAAVPTLQPPPPPPLPPRWSPASRELLAGFAAGAANVGSGYPFDTIKCRLQAAGSAARYPGGPLQVVRAVLLHEGGGAGLFRGLGATMVREVPGNALFFVSYEALRRTLSSAAAAPAVSAIVGLAVGAEGPNTGAGRPAAGSSEPAAEARRNWLAELAAAMLCGGTAGTIMWAAVMPIDVAKTRLQTARPGDAWDVGLVQHWAMLWREGRLAALYAGLTPTLLRAFPANAAQWLAWEACMRGLGGDRDT